MLKKISVPSYWPVLQLFIPPLSEMLCFSSCLFKAPPLLNIQSALIGQLAHAWASTTNSNRAAKLNQITPDTSHQANIANVCYDDAVWVPPWDWLVSIDCLDN